MHTHASTIEVSTDGKTATLSRRDNVSGTKLVMHILGGATSSAKFSHKLVTCVPKTAAAGIHPICANVINASGLDRKYSPLRKLTAVVSPLSTKPSTLTIVAAMQSDDGQAPALSSLRVNKLADWKAKGVLKSDDRAAQKCLNASNDRYSCAADCYCMLAWDEADVVVTRNLTYWHASDSSGVQYQLRLDLYEPPAQDTRPLRPVIVAIHGGSFRTGEKTKSGEVEWCHHLAARGYVCVSIDYRLFFGAAEPNGKCTKTNGRQNGTGNESGMCMNHSTGVISDDFLTAVSLAACDFRSAVAWLRTNAKTYRLDASRFAAFGSSAGAMTIAWSLTHDGAEGGCKAAAGWGVSTAIQAGVSLSGASLDFLPRLGQKTQAPYLDVHGCNDKTVPYGPNTEPPESIEFSGISTRDAFRSRKQVSALISIPGAGMSVLLLMLLLLVLTRSLVIQVTFLGRRSTSIRRTSTASSRSTCG